MADPEAISTALGQLTHLLAVHAGENVRRLNQLFVLLAVGCVMFLAEILAWLAQLLTR